MTPTTQLIKKKKKPIFEANLTIHETVATFFKINVKYNSYKCLTAN